MQKNENQTLKFFTKEGFMTKVENYMKLDKRTLAEMLAFKDILYSDDNKKWCPGIEAPTMLCDSISCSDYKIEGSNITAQA